VGRRKELKWEFGLRPVGAIGAYAPEGMWKAESKATSMGQRNLNAEVGMRIENKIGNWESGIKA